MISPRTWIIGLGLVLLGGTCQSPEEAPDFLETERARAMEWLSLQGARAAGSPSRVEGEWFRQVQWPIELDQRWTAFVARLAGARPEGYDRCSFGTRTGTCTRSLTGDEVSLHLRLATSGRITRIVALLRVRTL